MTETTKPTAAELLRTAFDKAIAHGQYCAAVDAAAALAHLESAQPLIVNAETHRVVQVCEPTDALIEAVGAEAEKGTDATPADAIKPRHPDAVELQFELGNTEGRELR